MCRTWLLLCASFPQRSRWWSGAAHCPALPRRAIRAPSLAATPVLVKIGLAIGAAYIGFYLPNMFIENLVQRRQTSIKNSFPDALDMLLICVQSGMSIEAAFQKVSGEVGAQLTHQTHAWMAEHRAIG